MSDKSQINLAGIYFGGISEDFEEAEQLARSCVNTIKGGTILPRIFETNQTGQLIELMYEAADRFDTIVNQMRSADEIIERSKKRRKDDMV